MVDEAVGSSHEPQFEVVWPLGKTAVTAAIEPGPPILDLNGKTVGELWDWLFKGPEMFAIIRQRLRERFPDVRFVDYGTFGNIHGSDEAKIVASLPDMLRRHGCDAVIVGVGA